MPTITSANSSFTIVVPGVFTSPVPLQGYGPDDAFDTEAVDAAEVQVGVDGFGVAGWVPRAVPQTISLIASSPSGDLFDQWMAAEDAIEDVIYGSGIIRIPSLSKQFAMSQGVLQRYPVAPNARRVLQPRQFRIVWLPQPGIPAVITTPL